mmetsp:Transcript_73955/g.217020  ORF Transcript_73955/g.217020 Transcript_73955/m.217020 type:complete len:246 (+) Transcript_73955:111-848(+)
MATDSSKLPSFSVPFPRATKYSLQKDLASWFCSSRTFMQTRSPTAPSIADRPPAQAAQTPTETRNSMGRCGSSGRMLKLMQRPFRTSWQLDIVLPYGAKKNIRTSNTASRTAPHVRPIENFSQASLGPKTIHAWKWPAMNSGGTICFNVVDEAGKPVSTLLSPTLYSMQCTGRLYSFLTKPRIHDCFVSNSGSSISCTCLGLLLRVHFMRDSSSSPALQSIGISSFPVAMTQMWQGTIGIAAPAS